MNNSTGQAKRSTQALRRGVPSYRFLAEGAQRVAPLHMASTSLRVFASTVRACLQLLPTSARAGWIATGICTAVAALVRLIGLNWIPQLIFDETYYVKDAYSLAHLGYEGTWAKNIDAAFAQGDFSGLSTDPSFVVHPQTGKWLIAAGAQIFGWDNPVGWRISAAVAGVIAVFLLCRIAWHLFHSPTLTFLAGIFFALDGLAIVMSRTSLLDGFLTMFVLAGFLALIHDQHRAQGRLAESVPKWLATRHPKLGGGRSTRAGVKASRSETRTTPTKATPTTPVSTTMASAPVSAAVSAATGAATSAPTGDATPTTRDASATPVASVSRKKKFSLDLSDLGPTSGGRWWLLAAGILFGLATSVKWSGLYAVAVAGLFVALREWTSRRSLGHPHAFKAAFLLELPLLFCFVAVSAVLTYFASWWSWFIHTNAWGHGAAEKAGVSSSKLVNLLTDFWSYQEQTLYFHTHLESPHGYQSNPLTWLFQSRPTSFAFAKDGVSCNSDKCVQAVLAIGNPLLWWFGIFALVFAIYALIRYRDWRVGLIVCGYLALYVPWLAYANRTIFLFYMVVLSPFVALCLAWALSVALRQVSVRPPRVGVALTSGLSGAAPSINEEESSSTPTLDHVDISAPIQPSLHPCAPASLPPHAPATVPTTPHRDAPAGVTHDTSATEHVGPPTGRRRLFNKHRAARPELIRDDFSNAEAILAVIAVVVVILVLAVSVFFYSIWTGLPIPFEDWSRHMWFRSWI